MEAPHLLILEDEEDAAFVLRTFLEGKGCRVSWSATGRDALRVITTSKPPITAAILDVMTPELSGTQVLQQVRKHPAYHRLPIILLTARDREQDEIAGLDAGADDYLPKPASLERVWARLQRLLDRRAEAPEQLLSHGRLKLNLSLRLATQGKRTLDLTATEFDLLTLLAMNPSRVFSRQEILDILYPEPEHQVFDRTIDAHVKNLRTKLAEQADLIRTVRGVGYGLNPPN